MEPYLGLRCEHLGKGDEQENQSLKALWYPRAFLESRTGIAGSGARN
jgi:hypothetical protein